LHTLYKIRFKPVQIVNLDGGAVENAVLAVFLRRHPTGEADGCGSIRGGPANWDLFFTCGYAK